MRAGRFAVSVELLGDVLNLPDNARIIQASISDDLRCVWLTVDDPSLPEAPEPHDADPKMTRQPMVRFEWRLKP